MLAVVFLPKLIQRAMKADVYSISKIFFKIFSTSSSDDLSVIETFGKNEQVKSVFWAVFVAVAGIVLTKILDPVTAQGIISAITGTGI